MVKPGTMGFEVHHQLAAGDLVMNERTDRFVVGDTPRSLGVCGVFELTDGRISAWRDYAPGDVCSAWM